MKLLYVASLALLFACSPAKKSDAGYSNKDIEISSDKLTPELMWQLGRVGNVSVSPDQSTILYTIAYTNIKENKSYTDVYTMNVDGSNKKQITNTVANENAVVWNADGSKINFISSESGSSQLWEMSADGSNRKQLTDIKGGITNFLISPDGSKFAYTAEVKLDEDIHDIHPDLPLANARIENDLMYRHWDRWEDENYSHVFIAAMSAMVTSGTDIMPGERFDAPLKPFGGVEQLAWSKDSEGLVYACKKLEGRAYAESTNADLYLYSTTDKSTINLTEGMMGYDLNPQFSPNGQYLAWESMERDGYESDRNRLFVLDVKTGVKTDITEGFDYNVHSIMWDASGTELSFTSNYHGCNQIYNITFADKKITKLTDGVQNYNSAIKVGEKYIATKTTMKQPTEIVVVDVAKGTDKNISQVNDHILAKIKMGDVESRWIETTDGKKMQTWVIYPPNFDKTKKYPTLLYCQGGPQSPVSQFWSIRWNFELMAANDYIIVAPNRRGLPGFGQEWNEQISGDYGGQNMKDYLSAIDALAEEPYVNNDKLGAIGASYGGYSVYWLAGNHNGRFNSLISHCGIFNFEQMYSTTEEQFFVNWDMKGAYWDKDNKVAQNTYANSPHKFVGKWDTPILVIHGEKDFRIPYTQGMGAFNTAKLRDLNARFLYFPTECHWVLSPQNGILWHREFFKWLDETLK
ncbi:S9 family peptidase [Saccharicrinis aurantiacus]|uniref:S9 family peptidase n=1 Tax=Saccharicrinis aurantiacus TaxID=1849719 RepID=UPI001FE9C706|nr:S9 family peptidase [Saccharicrinis aurantiacus]